jgi:hypothetical protein
VLGCWATAGKQLFVLDDFSFKICLKNVLLSKEGKTLSRQGHKLLLPLKGREERKHLFSLFTNSSLFSRRNAERHHHPHCHLRQPPRSG